MKRPGMNVFELGCFVLCCFVGLLVAAPLAAHFKLGWAGWIVGLPLGFFGCYYFISALFWIMEVLFKGLGHILGRFRRRK